MPTISTWIGYTYTDDRGFSTGYYDFAVCARLSDGSTLVQLEMQATPADIEVNLAAMEELVMGLYFDQSPTDIFDNKGGGALVEGFDAAVSGDQIPGRGASPSGDPITVTLTSIDQSGASGNVALTEHEDDAFVVATLVGAGAGDLVVIQAGDCSAMAGAPEYVAGSLTTAGTLTAQVDVELATLTGANPYAIAIYAGDDLQYAAPLACGVIDTAN